MVLFHGSENNKTAVIQDPSQDWMAGKVSGVYWNNIMLTLPPFILVELELCSASAAASSILVLGKVFTYMLVLPLQGFLEEMNFLYKFLIWLQSILWDRNGLGDPGG